MLDKILYFTFSIIIIVTIYFIIKELKSIQYIKDYKNIPDTNWPFLNFIDEKGQKVNMLCLRGPLQNRKEIDTFIKYKKQGFKFIGCSSYLSYPLKCNNPTQEKGVCASTPTFGGQRMDTLVDGWLHCFRDENIILNKNKSLISESDFMDSIKYLKNYNLERKKHRYDFICYCPSDPKHCDKGWHYHNKNWPLAKKTIEYLCNKMNMKGILVGRENCPIDIKNKENLERTDWLRYDKFLDSISDSKFMIISSQEDASPRTIGESLLVDTPILVNENILGGWKYVTEETGTFYNENNIEEKVNEIMINIEKKRYSPRYHYLQNYGMYNSGKKLRDFIVNIDPSLSHHQYIRFAVS